MELVHRDRVAHRAEDHEARSVGVRGPEPVVELRRRQPEALLGEAGLEVVHGAGTRDARHPRGRTRSRPTRCACRRSSPRRRSGNAISYAFGARSAGSRASSSWRMLVPDRAGPVMKTGAGTGVSRERGIAAVRVDDEEPRAEVTERVVSAHQPADDVEPGLVVRARRRGAGRAPPTRSRRSRRGRSSRRPARQLVGVERDERGRAADPRRHGVDASHPVRPLEQHFTHAAAT